MKIRVAPIKEVIVLGIDERTRENLMWCAASYRLERLFWADGYLFCLEPYEKSIDYEVEKGICPISQVCYVKFPKYEKYYEVEKGVQIPIVDVSGMRFYKELVRAIKTKDRRNHRNRVGKTLVMAKE
jgi:hypothetical protein